MPSKPNSKKEQPGKAKNGELAEQELDKATGGGKVVDQSSSNLPNLSAPGTHYPTQGGGD